MAFNKAPDENQQDIASRNRDYDVWTIEVIRRIAGVCVDVGTHAGDVLQAMIEANPKGRHVGFEPIPNLADQLRQRFPNLKIHQVALSNRKGFRDFQWVRNCPGYSGLRVIDYPYEPQIETIRVAVNTLDNLIQHQVDLIKIDVEGAELGVLEGAVETLRASQPVVVFEHGNAAAHYDTSPQQVFDVLKQCGLDVYLLPDWLQHAPALSLQDFCAETRHNWYFLAAPRQD